jgi:hypothetical protein
MSDIPGFWILISTLITVLTPIVIRLLERYSSVLIERFLYMFNFQNKWKNSVQLVSADIMNSFKSTSNTNTSYKAVMYQLMVNRNNVLPLNHIRQHHNVIETSSEDDSTDFLNRDLDFIATGYNKCILLDSDTNTYVIPTYEQESTRDTTTKLHILHVVSNQISVTEILNLITAYQVKYLDYIKRYNKDGKLKYVKLKPYAKDVVPHTSEGTGWTPPFNNGGMGGSSAEYIKRRTQASWDITDFVSSKTFSNVFFPLKDRILNQIDNFVTGEDFYRHRGIPWNLCILLHGIPGCGKTSFIKALANKTKRHLLDINLSNIITAQDFTTAFNTELFGDMFIPIDKRILVLEDIDCMNSGYLNKRQDNSVDSPAAPDSAPEKMNLSCFLNTLDGIQEHHGRILIATTNCINNLDPAVLRRFNVKVNFTHLNLEIAQSIVNNYYDSNVSLSKIPDNLTGSSLTQLCMMYQNEPDLLVKSLNH